MDIKDIRKIIELMKQNELSEFELQDEGFRIAVKRKNGETQFVTTAPVVQAPVAPLAPAPAPAGLAAETAPGVAPPEEETGVTINSPMVGTFYRAASPEDEPFAKVGTEVNEETVVCIVEAMKVMNEIKAETRGTIRKVCVENAQAVQFGQALFIIDPA